MSPEKFRKEAPKARRINWPGSISLAQPLPLRALTVSMSVATLLVGLFLVTSTYTRRSSVARQLVPSRGLATVLAPATGVVSRLDVVESGEGRAGQALAIVAVPRATVSSDDTAAALEWRLRQRQGGLTAWQRAQQRQLVAQDNGLQVQLVEGRPEPIQIEAEVTTRRNQIRIASRTLDSLRQLEGGQYVSVLQIKQQESTTLAYTGEMQTLQRQAINTRRTIMQIEQALGELPGQRQVVDATFARDAAQLQQEKIETEARSPRNQCSGCRANRHAEGRARAGGPGGRAIAHLVA